MLKNDLEKYAELLGVISGDGHVHKKENRITITGSDEDIYYYLSYVLPIVNELLDITTSKSLIIDKT